MFEEFEHRTGICARFHGLVQEYDLMASKLLIIPIEVKKKKKKRKVFANAYFSNYTCEFCWSSSGYNCVLLATL